MNDTAFTPGPWRYEETVCVKTGDDDLVALIYSTIKPSENGGESNLVANANLIAAAPDMFAKLERAAFIFRTYAEMHRAKKTDEGDAKAASNEVLAEEMETALAKARGEQVSA